MIRRWGGRVLEVVGETVFAGPMSFALVIVMEVVYYVELVVLARDPVLFESLFVVKPGLAPSVSWILGVLAHESVEHMARNAVILLIFGVQVEREWSSWWVLGLFVGLGVVAGLVHTNVTGRNAIGASAAGMGFAGVWFAAFVSSPGVRERAVENVGLYTAAGVPFAVAGLAVHDFWFATGTGGVGHLVGAVLGLVVGLVLVRGRENDG